MSENSYDIFVSYAEPDRSWAEGYLLDALKQPGVRVLTQGDFRLGAFWTTEFERAVSTSERVVLVLSGAYLASMDQQFVDRLSAYHSLQSEQPSVIPLLLEDVPLRLGLQALVPLKAFTDAEREDAVKRLCDELKVPLTEVGRIACPYPGMRPFTAKESEPFFGRDAEVEDLIRNLRLHPFVAVIGRSGTGKSSLVSAGLVPELTKSSFFGGDKWTTLSMRPGENPLDTFRSVVGTDADHPATAVARLLNAAGAQRLMLVIDQFEEVFTRAGSNEQGKAFQEQLLRWNGVANCYVVLTVRADFYPDLMTCPLWPQIQNHRFELLPMGRENLQEAIDKPATSVGVFVEPTLVERLLNDAATEPGLLPLMQETMVLLWNRLQRRFLPLSAYEELGRDDRNGLQVAMATRADLALSDLPDDAHRAIARRIFIRLVHFGEGRPDTRRQQKRSQLKSDGEEQAAFDRTLSHLINPSRLVVAGELDPQLPPEQQDPPIDIAHERLITGWPTLQKWLKVRRAAEQMRRRLEDKAAEWVRLERQGGLLDEVELREAQNWVANSSSSDLGATAEVVQLIKASETAINETNAADEQARNERLRQAESLANEQRLRAEEPDARRRDVALAAARLGRRTAMPMRIQS